jgi:hypothetical protein
MPAFFFDAPRWIDMDSRPPCGVVSFWRGLRTINALGETDDG